MEIQGFKFLDSNAGYWVLERVDTQFATLAQMLALFLEDWAYDPKPLGWSRNPEDKDGRKFMDIGDWIVAPCRRGFYLTIERSFNQLFGPHCVRLMYRSWQSKGDVVWVAICQIERVLWHNDVKMLASLQEQINSGALYQAEKTAGTIILR